MAAASLNKLKEKYVPKRRTAFENISVPLKHSRHFIVRVGKNEHDGRRFLGFALSSFW
jgi:hypothetical protein